MHPISRLAGTLMDHLIQPSCFTGGGVWPGKEGDDSPQVTEPVSKQQHHNKKPELRIPTTDC